MATVRPEARESGRGSAFKGNCRPEASRRGTVGTILRPETEVDEEGHVQWKPRRGLTKDKSRHQPRTEKSHSRDMKLDKYDGTTSIDSFLAKFEICAEHNEWWEKERLAQLQCALTNNAAQILWDTGTEEANTSANLISQLRARYGSESQKSLYQTQLRCRRRLRGESLTDLVSDIRRMMALAYPGPTSAMRESVACYAFLEALDDPVLALKIREREPPSLEQAFQIALRLEAYANAGAAGALERNDKDRRGQCRAAQEVVDKKPDDGLEEFLKELKQQQSHMQQLLGELRAVVSTTQNASARKETGTGDREQEATDLLASRNQRPRRVTVTC